MNSRSPFQPQPFSVSNTHVGKQIGWEYHIVEKIRIYCALGQSYSSANLAYYLGTQPVMCDISPDISTRSSHFTTKMPATHQLTQIWNALTSTMRTQLNETCDYHTSHHHAFHEPSRIRSKQVFTFTARKPCILDCKPIPTGIHSSEREVPKGWG